jgi:histidinol phosphatase-like PHP family hydrolase
LKLTNGLDEKQLLNQANKIAEINDKIKMNQHIQDQKNHQAHYDHLDLKDDYIRMAVENNIKLVIDSDAHHPVHFAFLKFGIGQARRGWAKQSDVLNTLAGDTLLKSLK